MVLTSGFHTQVRPLLSSHEMVLSPTDDLYNTHLSPTPMVESSLDPCPRSPDRIKVPQREGRTQRNIRVMYVRFLLSRDVHE